MSFFHKNIGKLEADFFLNLIAEYTAFETEDSVGYACLDFEMSGDRIKTVLVYSEGYSSYTICDIRRLHVSDWKIVGDNIHLQGSQPNEKERRPTWHILNKISDSQH
jgi:hypothetical protein